MWRSSDVLLIYCVKYVAQVAAGENHVVVLTSDGEVFSWGRHESGCLGRQEADGGELCVPGLVEGLNGDMSKLVCGKDCTGLLAPDGRLLVAGTNTNNRLDFDEKKKKVEISRVFREIDAAFGEVERVSMGENFTLLLNKEGEVWKLGGEKRNCTKLWKSKEATTRKDFTPHF